MISSGGSRYISLTFLLPAVVGLHIEFLAQIGNRLGLLEQRSPLFPLTLGFLLLGDPRLAPPLG
jgi:hypothetical protein